MALEPIYDVIKTEERSWPSRTQTVVEAGATPPGGVAIAKVLSVDANAVVFASEAFTGEARYNGRVDFTVLFADGNGKIQCMEFREGFTGKITSDQITSTEKPQFKCFVVDTAVESARQSGVRATCVVEIEACFDQKSEIKHLVACGADAHAKEGVICYTGVVSEGGKAIVVSGNVVGGEYASVTKQRAVSVINKTEALGDAVVVSGDVFVGVVAENENGKICLEKICIPFSEEISAPGSVKGAEVVASAFVKSVTTRTFVDDGKNVIECECEVEISFSVYAIATKGYICDLFSVKNNLNKKFLDKKLCSRISATRFRSVITEDMSFSDCVPEIESVLFADAFRAVVTACRLEDGVAVVEGVTFGNLLYECKEGTTCSAIIERPFSLNASVDLVANVESATVNVVDVAVKNRRSGEVELKIEVAVELLICEKKMASILVEVEEGEARDQKQSAVTIHVAGRGEQLWDIANALNVAPEVVIKQNPTLEFPLSGGERVMLYRNLTAHS